jgi:hypothetical protein
VARIGAAGEQDRIVTIAGVNVAFDFLHLGMRRSLRVQTVKAVGEMKGAVLVAENVAGRELRAVAHRLCVFGDDGSAGSRCSLLDRRINDDRSQRDAAHLHFGVINCIHRGYSQLSRAGPT